MAQDDSRIEQLKKKLYSNTGEPIPPPHRGRLHPHASIVNSAWKGESSDDNGSGSLSNNSKSEIPKVMYGDYDHYSGSYNPVLKKILIGTLIFFVIAAAVTAYIFYKGSNVVSPNNIDIKMLGPVSSPAGEILSVDVDISNNNSSQLNLADLVVTYPDGTRSAKDKVTPMISDRVIIGTIGSGKTVRKTLQSILFGEENARKNIKISLEYSVPGTNSVFVKSKDYPVFIGSSPVTLTVDALKEITADQQAIFKITVVSNSTEIIKNLLLKADYPFGFQFKESTPASVSGKDTWSLGDLEPGGRREITLAGKIVGEANEERIFNFAAGTEDPKNSTEISTVFVTSAASVAVKKPFLGADVALNGDGLPIVVVDAGDGIKGEITWQNNLNVPVNDVVATAVLSGDMLDKTSVSGDQGYYRSIDNTVLWDKSTLSDLSEVAPGDVGRLIFSFASLPATISNNTNFRRPVLHLTISLKAKRLNENNVPEDVTSTVSRDIKIQSGIDMTTRLVRNVGPFENTGPMPPQAEKETTYTVLVHIANSFNTVKDAVFTTSLPSYVKWLGVVTPANGGVTYNPDSRELSWTLGDIAPGTGYNSSAKEFAFQVSFLPSISQRGQSPIIVNSQKVAGKDAFTSTIVSNQEPALDTKIGSDPTFVYGQDKVSQ